MCFFSCQYNPKNLDPSYKMDLDFWGCFGGGKEKTSPILQQNYTRPVLDILVHSREVKILSYSRINIVFWLSFMQTVSCHLVTLIQICVNVQGFP